MDEANKVTYFAQTDYRSRVPFGIKASDRSKHVYVIGKTGMGKSTLLENMAIQDIQNGNGMAFMDPHGKTAELLLEYVPEERLDDVVYFAPFDMDYPLSFNIMEDVGYDKRHLVVAGLMSAFKKIWVDAWSARMEYILNNVLLALLEYPDSTLLGVNRMLIDKHYRKMVVDNIKDPSTRSFWVDEFAKYTDRYTQEATPAIQNKVGQFTANPLIRNIIGQPKSSFNLRQLLDEKKIIIVNLSKGRIGEGNANLLGSMLITKLYLSAMSRADLPEHELNKLPNHYLFVDEFQSFANESFADILSEARKYKLNLTLAHQYIEQMSEEVRSAVFGNVGTMITFRVGAYDAEVLEKEYAPKFYGEDMVNLGFTQVYLKLMIDGVSSHPFSATTLPPIQHKEVTLKDQVIERSRKQFAQPRSVVQSNIDAWYAHNYEDDIRAKKDAEKALRGDAPLSSAGGSSDYQERDSTPRRDGHREVFGPGEMPKLKNGAKILRPGDRRKNDNRQKISQSTDGHGRQYTGPDRRSNPPGLDRRQGDRRQSTDRPSFVKREQPAEMKSVQKQALKEESEKEKKSGNMVSLQDALKAVIDQEQGSTGADRSQKKSSSGNIGGGQKAAMEGSERPAQSSPVAKNKPDHPKQTTKPVKSAPPQGRADTAPEQQGQNARPAKEVPEDVLRQVLNGE